jgi:hypothetical protein
VTDEAVRAAFAEQAGWCEKLDSPFTAMLCRLIGARIDRSTGLGRRVLDWTGDPRSFADNVPLRVCGGLHYLVRRGEAPGLARLYPPRPPPGEETLWRALEPVLADARLPAWLDGPPQTNEVGRSAVLMAGLLAVAARFPFPVDLLELGASAGLNLLLDHYGYDLGGRRAGNAESALQLAPAWEGPPPPAAPVEVVRRRGVDLNPIDPVRDGERLLAYIWPDQSRRLAQLEAALAVAAAGPPPVDRGEAAEWLGKRLAEPAAAGATRVVLHSIAFQYFPASSRRRIESLMAEAGAAAGPETPVAWLRYEKEPGEERMTLRLRLWPDGEERLLAICHPHGSRVRWLKA